MNIWIVVIIIACFYAVLYEYPRKVKRVKHFVTFGNERFKKSRTRIRSEAQNTGLFDIVKAFSQRDLKLNPQYWDVLGKFTSRHARGYGYWVWKPFLLYNYVKNEAQNGDIIVYADAGCRIDAKYKRRLSRYIHAASSNTSGLLTFHLGNWFGTKLSMRDWTRRDVAEWLGYSIDGPFMERPQIAATAFVICKNETSMKILKHWYELAVSRPDLFADGPSDHEGYKEHRHDQSIFSILCYANGVVPIEDEMNEKYAPIKGSRLRE